MRRAWLVVGCVAACTTWILLARTPAAADEQAFTGPGVHVTAADCPPDTAKRAGELLISALPNFPEAMPLRLPAGEQLTIHLYGTAEGYREAVTAAGAPGLADNLAGTSNSTKECYLVLQPRSDLAAIEAAGGIPEMTRWLLFHEVAHQISHRADPAAQNWPAWFEEGMAEDVAKRIVRSTSSAGKPSMVEQDKAHHVLEALGTGRLPTLAQLVHARATELTTARRSVYYAAWGALYDLLSKDSVRLATLHTRIHDIAASDETRSARRMEDEYVAALEAVYGPLAELEKRLVATIRAATPEWFEGSRSTQRIGDAWVCTAFPEGRAYALREEPSPGVPYRITTEWTLRDFGQRQMEIYLGYQSSDNPRYLKIAFRSEGSVTLLAYAEGYWLERYRTNASVDSAILAPGTPHKTTIDVDGKALRVEVDGKTLLDTAPPAGFDVLRGRVGFGVSDGIATFRGFEVTPRK